MEYPSDIPQLLKNARVSKNKHSQNLGRQHVRKFVLGHFLFLGARKLAKIGSLLGTDHVRGHFRSSPSYWHVVLPGTPQHPGTFWNIPEHPQENQEHPPKNRNTPKKTRNTPKKTRNLKKQIARKCYRAR